MASIKIETPIGTTGLAVEPWSRGEIYAVAANWAQATYPVYTYSESGWEQIGRQVADYRHRPRAALEAILRDAMIESGGGEPDDDVVCAIVDKAVEIVDQGGER